MEKHILLELRHNDDLLDLVAMDLINNGFPRQIYIRNDHFNTMSDKLFFQHFRLRKETVLYVLLPQLEPKLEYIHNLNNSVSPINQLLICLRYFATSCHQLSLAHFGNMHKSSVNRIIKRVTEAICYLASDYISFPMNEDEIQKLQLGFYEKASFPRVIAAIDCTHIKINAPGGQDAEIYRNRKGYFSVNVQAAVDYNYKFLNIVARWPGSVHDVTTFNNSVLRARLENNHFPHCFILGDSGYGLKNYLMTPLLETHTEAERKYNESHILTRVVIENTFGIWKRRFPILAYGCRTKLNLTLNIIVATAVLHNIARNAGEDDPPLENNLLMDALIANGNIPHLNGNNIHGIQIRQNLINNYFSLL